MPRHPSPPSLRISDRIVGEPLKVGAWTLRPVVRVGGWRLARGGSSGGSGGGRLRVRRVGVIVLERDGREHRVPTPDGTRRILWGMAGVALVVTMAAQAVVGILRRTPGFGPNGDLLER